MINTKALFERHDHPFPYYTIADVVSPDHLHRLNADLPSLNLFKREVKQGAQHRKQYTMWHVGLYEDDKRTPVTELLPLPWRELLDSLLSPEFTTWASEGLHDDLGKLRLTLGLYRYSDQDYTTADIAKQEKAYQWALYLNEEWDESDGGALHFWTAKDASEPAASIIPRGGTCALFRPSPVTWHNIGRITSAGTRERITIMIEYWKV